MSSQPSASIPEFTFVLLLLVPLALAGLALMNDGLGRARSATHAMFSAVSATGVAVVTYCIFGFHWEGLSGGASHVLLLRGQPWDWLGRGPFFLHGVSPDSLQFVLFQSLLVGLAALPAISAGADRWRLGATCASTAFLAAVTYPVFAHWVWAGGWLSQLGTNYHLGNGFVDAGGAGTVHVVGGLTALAVTWILGPRIGRYSQDGMATASPGHNMVYVQLGCLLLIPGWTAINCLGSVFFAHGTTEQLPLIALNTVLCGLSALLAALLATRLRFGKPDSSLSANGFVGGLVASSAIAMLATPGVAIVVGLIAGWGVMVSVELLEVHLKVDDPGGAISSHAFAGCWGLLAAGLFGGTSKSGGQMVAQLVGIATLIGFVLPLAYGANWVINRITPYRVEEDGERMGMDLDQMGAGAYPEFAVYTEETRRR